MRATVTAVALAVLALSGCFAAHGELRLALDDGAAEKLVLPPEFSGTRSLVLRPVDGVRTTSPISLRRPVSIPPHRSTLYVDYAGTVDHARIEVYSAPNRLETAVETLPFFGDIPVRIGLSLPSFSTFWGFTVATDSDSGTLEILELSFLPPYRGARVDQHRLVLGPAFRTRFPVRLERADLGSIELVLAPEIFRAATIGERWALEVEIEGPAGGPGNDNIMPGAALVVFTSESGIVREFRVRWVRPRRTVSFYEGIVGFVPASVTVLTPDAEDHLTVRTIDVKSVGPSTDSNSEDPIRQEALRLAPLRIDLGGIVDYDPSYWRTPEFEVFRWSLFPQVLIFYTRNYDVQARLFKRLAFFVEKDGFRGTIPEFEDIIELHGFNAHDYRAADLRSFFDAATARGVKPGKEERVLQAVLIRNGIIGIDSGAGTGSVLSISRSSRPALRERFLRHESYHGAFFSLPEFRAGCEQIWRNLDQLERSYWKLFLSALTSAPPGYDTGYEYLVINEFQAYLLQNTRAEIAELQAVSSRLILNRVANGRDVVQEFQDRFSSSFLDAYDKLDRLLRDVAGLRGGGLETLF